MDRKAARDIDKEQSNQNPEVLKDKSNNIFDIPANFNIDKHLNSRLFKRFLEEESKLQKAKPKLNSKEKPVKKETPPPPVVQKQDSPVRERQHVQYYQPSPETPKSSSSKYHSIDAGEIKGYSQHIPAYIPQVDISRQNSFANFPHQYQQYPPMQQFIPNFFPYQPQMYPQMQYPPDMMLRQQAEALQSQLQYFQQNDLKFKEEHEKEKREFQEIISIKDSEIIKLKKTLENRNFDIMDLEDQLRNCNGDDFANLQKRCMYLEEQLQKGNNKNDFRDRCEEAEGELRGLKGRYEELQRDYGKAKEKIEDLENKVNNNKNSSNAEKDLARAEDRIEVLEYELDSAKKAYSKEIKQLTLENEMLKQQINNLKKSQKEDIEERYYENQEDRSRTDEIRRSTAASTRDSHSPMIRNMSRTNNSTCVESALTWETPPRTMNFTKKDTKRPDTSPIPGPRNEGIDPLSNMESKLNMLSTDKQRLENEYMRIPHTTQNKRRKEELELEIDILNTNIGNLKNKIRNMR